MQKYDSYLKKNHISAICISDTDSKVSKSRYITR